MLTDMLKYAYILHTRKIKLINTNEVKKIPCHKSSCPKTKDNFKDKTDVFKLM